MPLLPLCIFWDGLVSCLRTYRVDELRALVDGLDDGYRWEAGTVRKAGRNVRAALKGKRQVFFTRPQRKFINTPVYDYERLGVGTLVRGPAIIELPFTTTLVPPEHKVSVDPYRNLVMEVA